jgi:hypothetical protein
MKFVTFAAASAGESIIAFQRWFAGEYAPKFNGDLHGLLGAVMRLSQPAPAGGGTLHDPAEPAMDAAHLPFHALLESWFVTAEDFRAAARIAEPTLRARGTRFVSYRVTPHLEKDPRIAEAGAGGTRPGMTFITPVTWLAGLSRTEARRHWDEHVSSALRIHGGLTKYERNWVDEVVSWSADAKPVDAYADFSFRTRQDFVEKFFAGEADLLEVTQDIANFIGTASTLFLDDAHGIYG